MDDVVEKRLDLLVFAKLRDRTRLERALLTQDRLREKSKAWNGVGELRRWRDARGSLFDMNIDIVTRYL